ncbi:hypothetical protein [Gordonia sp. MMO-8]|uniref:hypothetical protein n=1 Tax=Gordonia sp. MMO-8 TaxID=3127886 RepID=UPI003015D8BF
MSRTPRRYVIDATEHSAVVRCTRCPWRGFSHSKSVAYRQVAAHLYRVHDDYKAAEGARRAA